MSFSTESISSQGIGEGEKKKVSLERPVEYSDCDLTEVFLVWYHNPYIPGAERGRGNSYMQK